MEPSVAAISAVREAVRAAMLVETGRQHGWIWDAAVRPEDFLAAVSRHRVTEVMALHAEELRLPAPVTVAVREARDAGRLTSMLLTRDLMRASKVLDAAGVAHLTFKGAALAQQTTGDFAARGPGDLDIFVSPAAVAVAHDELVANGWAPVEPFPAPGDSWAWRHLVRTYYQLPLVGERSTIDLHWWLDPSRAALPDFRTAWQRRAEVAPAGARIDTLSAPDAFRHTCSHASKDDWRWLRSLVDLHRLARDPSVWASVTELDRVEAMSIAVTTDTIGLPEGVPPTILGSAREVPARVRTRARRAQEAPASGRSQTVGAGVRSTLPRYLRGRSSVADVARILYDAVLPAAQLGGITDPHATTALPRAVRHRLVVALGKVRSARTG